MLRIVWPLADESSAHRLYVTDRQIGVRVLRERKEFTMSLINRSKLKHGLIALPIMAASILLAAPAAQAHVGFGITLGFPPVVVPPPVVVGPPVVAGPPAYYAPPYYAPPPYYYAPAPSYGFFWYDHFGHRHWHR